jgi:hypothetical protein
MNLDFLKETPDMLISENAVAEFVRYCNGGDAALTRDAIVQQHMENLEQALPPEVRESDALCNLICTNIQGDFDLIVVDIISAVGSRTRMTTLMTNQEAIETADNLSQWMDDYFAGLEKGEPGEILH